MGEARIVPSRDASVRPPSQQVARDLLRADLCLSGSLVRQAFEPGAALFLPQLRALPGVHAPDRAGGEAHGDRPNGGSRLAPHRRVRTPLCAQAVLALGEAPASAPPGIEAGERGSSAARASGSAVDDFSF